MLPQLGTRFVFVFAGAVLAYAAADVPNAAARESWPKPPRERTEHVGDTRIAISIDPGHLAVDDPTLARLLGDSTRAIAVYYGGKLPFENVHVDVTPVNEGGINGSTRCSRGVGRVFLKVGPHVKEADFRDDWVVTHELLHVAFTSLTDDMTTHEWVGEGLSSYAEPLVRVRAGTLSEQELWHELVRGAPQGLPEPGDEGLDKTHTWGRTYWGGALFWLEVDLAIRDQTQNQRSIRDVLRAVAAAGTNVCVDWPMERVIATGDAATGTHALADVYARRALTNAAPDLASIWQKLGITLQGGKVLFNDAAPWATTRVKMTRD
jgi:hypothetical protein